MLVEAAWAAAKAPGPLHASSSASAPGGLTSRGSGARAQADGAMELQAGLPQKKGRRRDPAYAYNLKALRDQERQIAERGRKVL